MGSLLFSSSLALRYRMGCGRICARGGILGSLVRDFLSERVPGFLPSGHLVEGLSRAQRQWIIRSLALSPAMNLLDPGRNMWMWY
ncbi:hypothetical protein R1flu_028166 [Riccia fluitans]|uniref:Uncharacterized protein n=1 Tax=Riccia fluitans TaxID=41844 RepID=A0ABD1XKW6_9MARC